MTRLLRRLLKVAALLATLGLLAIAALAISLSAERRTELTLPAPTGSFAVGRIISDWRDSATVDNLAPVRGTKRELLVWTWYPSAAPRSAAIDDYVPPELRPKPGGPTGPAIFRLISHDLSKVHEHSARNSPLSPGQHTYPVVIMRAGASTSVLNYSTLAEDLASYGYVVVGLDAPYRTGVVIFPDGRMIRETPENNPELCISRDRVRQEACVKRIIDAWTGDIAFVLDRLVQVNAADSAGRFTGRLDMTRVGVFGHSLGGATAAQFCHEDARCKAGIDIDGAPHGSVVAAGIHRPFMFFLSDHSAESDPESRQILSDIQSIYDRLPKDARARITIRGANHFTFSDDGALLKSRALRGLLRLFGKLGIDARRQLAITAYCVHSFFDAYLKAPSGSRLTLSSPIYPEMQVLP